MQDDSRPVRISDLPWAQPVVDAGVDWAPVCDSSNWAGVLREKQLHIPLPSGERSASHAGHSRVPVPGCQGLQVSGVSAVLPCTASVARFSVVCRGIGGLNMHTACFTCCQAQPPAVRRCPAPPCTAWVLYPVSSFAPSVHWRISTQAGTDLRGSHYQREPPLRV